MFYSKYGLLTWNKCITNRAEQFQDFHNHNYSRRLAFPRESNWENQDKRLFVSRLSSFFPCHHASVFIIIYKLCSILHCWLFIPPSFMLFFFASQRCLFYMSFFMMSESLFFNDHVHCAFSVKEIQLYYFCNGKTLNWVCKIWWINQSIK